MSLIAAIAGTLSAVRVTLSDQSISDVIVGVGAASASYQLTSSGIVNQITTSGTVALENWVTPTSAAGASYEAQVTVTSGVLTSGTTGSWLALNSTQTWNLTRPNPAGVGSDACTFTIEIRQASSGTVLATATIDLYVEKL